MIELTLPWPPSVNSYKKIGRMVRTKTGKIYQQRVNSDETRTFYYQVYMLTKQKVQEPFRKEERVNVEVILYPPNNRFDIDNPIKVLLDSLTRAKIWADDVQIDRLLVIKKLATPHDPKVMVTVSQI